MSQPQYAYAAAPAPAPRHYSTNHGTSSAFSSSANPDEDWTKISDLAERRRIQNRIAQRNYRKKLKRRLEDLERKAGDRTPGESSSQSTPKPSKRVQPAKAQKNAQPLKPMPQNQYLPDLREGDHLLYPAAFDGRERSLTPPLFTYSTYPPPEELLIAPYSQSPSYPVLTTTEAYPAYLATTMPATLPSMTHFSDATKRDSYSDAGLSPYMSYGFIPSVDVHSPPHYDHSNPDTPPLSHSFDHSANCSDSGYDYPTTPPLSIPGSPGIVQLDLSGRA